MTEPTAEQPGTADRTEAAPPTRGLSRIGWVRYFFTEDRWEWSDEVAQMHGYAPGTVTPTTELILAHKHPSDRDELAALLARIRKTHEPFSSRHRIRDTSGRVHHVVVVGNQMRNDAGQLIGSDGFYIDQSGDDETVQELLSEQVRAVAERRSAIDQAKGMLMMVYGINDEAAFDLLRWRSQQTNIKLRALAGQVVADFTGVPHNGQMPARAVYDNLLMTAHLRARHDRGAATPAVDT